MMLDNITVYESDLEVLQPNITNMRFKESATFEGIVLEIKRTLYSRIKADYIAKNGDSNTIDSTLSTIRDYPQELNLKNIIVRKVIAMIYRQNEDYDSAQVWETEANQIPLIYGNDTDNSGTISTSEKIIGKRNIFTR